MDDLVEWLREQIAQLQRAAMVVKNRPNPIAVRRRPGAPPLTQEDRAALAAWWKAERRAVADHTVLHVAEQVPDLADPDAVLAQCEAHERVLERHRRPRMDDSGESWMEPNSCAGCGVTGATDLPRTDDINDCPELRDMALAYQHRPGYRSEWKP